MSFTTSTKVEYPDGTVQTTETTGTAKSKWAPIFDDNIIMLTDSYKLSHFKQYPPGTQYVYSYFESRGGKFDEVTFFGLQYFIKRYLSGPVVTEEKIQQAKKWCTSHMTQPGVEGSGEAAFNEPGWRYILETHGGVLPIKIKAVPEGTVVPNKNVLFTMENTDPECFWLTNYLESLLVQVWHPMTVSTNSRACKRVIMEAFKETGCEINFFLTFKLHDFGFRGVSSVESAATGGAGHLVNFSGTDTMAGYLCAAQYYGEEMAGWSIPAAEHSTITSWGKEGEVDAFKNMLTQYPKGLVAVVSDSFDIIKACTDYWGGELIDLIKNRDGVLVVRPDSGDPATIVVEVLEALGSKFPTTETSTGHKMLPPYLRVIQGDGISLESLKLILDNMTKNGWAADNLAFGSGGALLQKLNRDTQKCAFKCCSIVINGVEREVFKDPITDPGKRSKKGRLTLENRAYPADEAAFAESGIFGKFEPEKAGTPQMVTVCEGKGNAGEDILQEVFNNGTILVDHKFAEIRARAELPGGPFAA